MPSVNTLPPILCYGFTISNYKMYCHCCDIPINRGDKITKYVEREDHFSMTLRSRNVKEKDKFYKPCTGSRWIHKTCSSSDEICTDSKIKYLESTKEKKGWNEEGFHDGFNDNYLSEWDDWQQC